MVLFLIGATCKARHLLKGRRLLEGTRLGIIFFFEGGGLITPLIITVFPEGRKLLFCVVLDFWLLVFNLELNSVFFPVDRNNKHSIGIHK